MVHLSDPGEHVSRAWTCPAVSGSYVDESSQLVRLNGAEKIKTIITVCGAVAFTYSSMPTYSSGPPSTSLISDFLLPPHYSLPGAFLHFPKTPQFLSLAHRFFSLLCLSLVIAISSCAWMRSHWSRMNLLFLLSAAARAQIWHHISDATWGLLHNTHTYFKFTKCYFILTWNIKIQFSSKLQRCIPAGIKQRIIWYILLF